MFGIEVGPEHLLETHRSRGCGHIETPTKFCADCGKPIWNEKKYTRDLHEVCTSTDVGQVGVLRFRDNDVEDEPRGIVGKMLDLVREYNHAVTDPIVTEKDTAAILAFCTTHNIPFDKDTAKYYLVCN